MDPEKTANKSPDDYILKVMGRNEYIVDENQLLGNYEYIRKCMCKNKKLFLSFIPFVPPSQAMLDNNNDNKVSVLDQILAEQDYNWEALEGKYIHIYISSVRYARSISPC